MDQMDSVTDEQMKLLKSGGTLWRRRMLGDLGEVFRGEKHHTAEGFLQRDIQEVEGGGYEVKAPEIVNQNRREFFLSQQQR